MLYYTSCLFGFVAIHAVFANDLVMVLVNIPLAMASILHHSFYTDTSAHPLGTLISTIDRILCRALGCIVAYRILFWYGMTAYNLVILLCIAYSVGCYYVKLYHISDVPYPTDRIIQEQWWHASMHAVAAFGLHVCLYAGQLREKIMHPYDSKCACTCP